MCILCVCLCAWVRVGVSVVCVFSVCLVLCVCALYVVCVMCVLYVLVCVLCARAVWEGVSCVGGVEECGGRGGVMGG